MPPIPTFEKSHFVDEDGRDRFKLTLQLDGRKAGSMELIAKPEEGHLKVDDVHILPEHRGKGHGKALYGAAVQLAKELGLPELRSGYYTSPAAMRVWESLGAEPTDYGWRIKASKRLPYEGSYLIEYEPGQWYYLLTDKEFGLTPQSAPTAVLGGPYPSVEEARNDLEAKYPVPERRWPGYVRFNNWNVDDQTKKLIEMLLPHREVPQGRLVFGAARTIWYHGTSLRNKQPILSQGLIPDPKVRAWQEDPHAGMMQPSRKSYGGIYVTRNLMTAIGSVNDKKEMGGLLIACMELQPNTLFLDEDDVKYQVQQPLGANMSSNPYWVLQYYLAATHERMPNEWKKEVDSSKEHFASEAIRYWKWVFSQHKAEMHPDLEKRLRGMLPEVWFASLERLAGHAADNAEPYDMMRAYSAMFGTQGYDYDEVKSQIRSMFPSSRQGEESFIRAVEPLTRALRQLARYEDVNPVARSMEPIGYSGANRITAVVEVMYPEGFWGASKPDNPYVMNVLYGKLPKDFIEQWRQRMGGHWVVNEAKEKAASSEGGDEVRNPLHVTPSRPEVIEDWKYLPEEKQAQMVQEAPLVEVDPATLKTSQETVSRKDLSRFLKDPSAPNKRQTMKGDEQEHPLVLGTSEGDYVYDGNHRCAAALLNKELVKVKYIDLRSMEGGNGFEPKPGRRGWPWHRSLLEKSGSWGKKADNWLGSGFIMPDGSVETGKSKWEEHAQMALRLGLATSGSDAKEYNKIVSEALAAGAVRYNMYRASIAYHAGDMSNPTTRAHIRDFALQHPGKEAFIEWERPKAGTQEFSNTGDFVEWLESGSLAQRPVFASSHRYIVTSVSNRDRIREGKHRAALGDIFTSYADAMDWAEFETHYSKKNQRAVDVWEFDRQPEPGAYYMMVPPSAILRQTVTSRKSRKPKIEEHPPQHWLFGARKTLREELEALRPAFAQAAQEAYEWGPEHVWQGVCYPIAQAVLEAAFKRNPRWGGDIAHGRGKNHHSWAVICDHGECYKVDIPYTKYEKVVPREEVRGNVAYDYDMPYSFELLPDVEFKPEDIEIKPAPFRRWKDAAGYTPKEMEVEAQAYEDQFEAGSPGAGPASNYAWQEIKNFPVDRLEGTPQEWKEWLDQEKEWAAEGGRPEKYYEDMEKWWTTNPDEHMIVVRGTDGKYHVWEGTHRWAISKIHGMKTVPVFLGLPKGRKAASMPPIDRNGWITPKGKFMPLKDGENHSTAAKRLLHDDNAVEQTALNAGYIRLHYRDYLPGRPIEAGFLCQKRTPENLSKIREAIHSLSPETKLVAVSSNQPDLFDEYTYEEALEDFPRRSAKVAAYTAYVLTDASRDLLLNKLPPRFPDVIAHHVTVQFGVPRDANVPEPAKVEVVGYAADDSLEAAVVSVNGETKRPDGSAYHITLSLDRSKGRKPKDSNAVVANGWEPIPAFPVETLPQKLATAQKGKQAAVHTRQMADEVIQKLEQATGIRFGLIGSIAEKGESQKDIDLLWPEVPEEQSLEEGEEVQDRLFKALGSMGFEWLGRTDYGETWARQDGTVLDFWEAEPSEFFGKEAAQKTADHVDEEGNWAGEGGAASGVLPVCPATGRIGLAMRSGEVDHPHTYSTIGGAVQQGMSPEESAKEELGEETGYRGAIKLVPAYVFSTEGGFRYHNYVGIVPQEFGLHPEGGSSAGVKFRHETSHLDWMDYRELAESIKEEPGKYHPGLLKLLVHSSGIIERALHPNGMSKKEAAGQRPMLPKIAALRLAGMQATTAESMRMWHGTNRKAPPTHYPVYFAEEHDDAAEYGKNVFEAVVTPRKTMVEPSESTVRHDPPEKVKELLEIFRIPMEDYKLPLTEEGLGTFVKPEGVYYPVLTDYPEVIIMMQRHGYDSTWVWEPIASTGTSFMAITPSIVQWMKKKKAGYTEEGKVAFPKLYHGSRAKLAAGTILTPQPETGYVGLDDKLVQQTEEIIERNRPKGMLPRKDSVYMVADPDEIDSAGGYEDYVYEVQPIGKVERNDMSWYSDVGIYYWDDLDDPEATKAAKAYWAGVRHPGDSSLWEYRAPKAKIIRLVSSTEEEGITASASSGQPGQASAASS